MIEKFVELGADCVICGRRGGVLEETAEEVMAKYPGRRVDTHTVRHPGRHGRRGDGRRASGASGPLDGLVNNAAGNFISQTKDLSPRAFDAIAGIVLHGTFYMTNACGKRWIAEKRKASVLSILTTWVWTGSPFVVPSAMSKAGVAVMTQSLAVEWGRHGIRLNAIAPGPFPDRGRLGAAQPEGGDDDRYKDRNPHGPRRPAPRARQHGGVPDVRGGRVHQRRGHRHRRRRRHHGQRHLLQHAAYSDDDWRRIREQIQSTNAADRAKRTTCRADSAAMTGL